MISGMTMTARQAADVLIRELRLAAERVTGEDPQAKRDRRKALRNAAAGIDLKAGFLDHGVTAAEARELLGDPDDREVRQALEAWEAAGWSPVGSRA